MVQWLRLRAPGAGGPGSIPGQGTRSHVLQLKIRMPQMKILHAATKIPCAATKTQCTQIKILINFSFLKKESFCYSEYTDYGLTFSFFYILVYSKIFQVPWIIRENYKIEDVISSQESYYLLAIKCQECGASLVAQWLRIRLPVQGTRVRALVWEDPTCRGATKPVRHN